MRVMARPVHLKRTKEDALKVARRHELPEAFVDVQLGKLNPGEIELELQAIEDMVVELDERILLSCCCAPAQCHLDHLALVLNLRIRARRETAAFVESEGCNVLVTTEGATGDVAAAEVLALTLASDSAAEDSAQVDDESIWLM